MSTITINGQSVIIDPEDYYIICSKKWQIVNGYARRHLSVKDGKRVYLYMHHEILGFVPKKGLVIDHINRNRLDNRKSNLRVVTHSKNSINISNGVRKRGVTFYHKNRSNPWRARIGQRNIGYFNTYEDAVRARLLAEDML